MTLSDVSDLSACVSKPDYKQCQKWFCWVAGLAILVLSTWWATGADRPPEPGRIVTEYALTSAANNEWWDPQDWSLLASNDGGNSWTVLDVRTNQEFTARRQRRRYPISNDKVYSTYRLQMESAGPVQLAEFELLGPVVGVAEGSELQAEITSSREHPLIGPAIHAFDGDPETRWLDFGDGHKVCWLQARYTRHAEVLVTNVSQFVIYARRASTRNPLADEAPHILSLVTTASNQPSACLTGYALTSANDFPERDPLDWRLLGSSNGGKTWEVLDIRRNESFATRFQRRVFTLARPAGYPIYRLQIDSVRVPDGLVGGASCVQLAEIEPLYLGAEPDNNLSLVVSAQGENPPIESADAAFDGDAKTKWLDFAESRAGVAGPNTNRSSWIQWQYVRGQEQPIINLRWLHSRPTKPARIQFEGMVVAWEQESGTIGFLDETGFQNFRLSPVPGQVRPGDRIRLAGRPRLGKDVPVLVDAELKVLGAAPVASELSPNSRAGGGNAFVWGKAQGKVNWISEDSLHVDVNLTPENGSGELLARIVNLRGNRIPQLIGCQVQVEGVVESVLDENGNSVPGVVWVPDLHQVTLVANADKPWDNWPLFTAATLARTNHPVTLGTRARVLGTVSEQGPGRVVLTNESGQISLRSEDSIHFLPGNPVEAIGFVAREGSLPALRLARLRSPGELRTMPTARNVEEPGEDQPVTHVREVYDLIEKNPGKQFPVRLRGVITYIDVGLGNFYLQDGSDGILANGQTAAGLAPRLQQEGSFVELEGKASPDQPAVDATSFVKVLGRGRLPQPRRHSLDQLMTGADLNQWVEIEGVVRQIEEHRLVLIIKGGKLPVWINEIDKRAQERLLGSTVRICGVCAAVTDRRNRRLGIQLLVPSMEQVSVLKPVPDDPFDVRVRPISNINQTAERTALGVQMLKTTGVVTHAESRLVFLQDGTDGLRVFTRVDSGVEPGDKVEVIGFAEADGLSPKLVQALVRKQGHTNLPPAQAINLLEIEVNGQDATRGYLEATLLGCRDKDALQILELRDQKTQRTFSAFFPTNHGVLAPSPPGSRVRVQGVFKAETETLPDFGQVISTFQMYGNTPEDLVILEKPPWWTARHTLWALSGSVLVLLLSLAWVGMLRKQVQQRTHQLHAEIAEHQQTESKLEAEIAERKSMQSQVEKTHRELMAVSRQAGMAEVATSVLHNVGNVLNSVNVSANLVGDILRKSRVANLSKALRLIPPEETARSRFFQEDPKGKRLPEYLGGLADHLASEHAAATRELGELSSNIQHIKEIVTMQQSSAKAVGLVETVQVRELVEDALRLNAAALSRHEVQVIREFESPLPPITVEKHKVLQILTNLVQNAKLACDEAGRQHKQLHFKVTNRQNQVQIAITDNGIGIAHENLTRIFNHGFTTRKDGHGFGLHSGALAAREMGGILHAHSEGVGKGATFILELPLQPKEQEAPAGWQSSSSSSFS